jgi:hypothetical protein
MKLTNFEQTGLDKVSEWIDKYHLKYISTDQLKEALKTVNVAFLLEEIDRVQSTLLYKSKAFFIKIIAIAKSISFSCG